ncbi:MAG: NAD(P)/FAD-dependent oxidoreductase [Euryarchaeota archaeon]|nr:NAD(P)/FAD-dependent oxidoreductase [Euryarchaeota archaeon]
MRTIVIGGGLTGLAAAYFLCTHRGGDSDNNSEEVILVEEEENLGGLANSYARGGYTIEKFYHHIFSDDVLIQQLIKELGLLEKLEWRIGTTGYYINGKIHRLNTPLEILKFDHLTFFDKVLLAKAVLSARRLKDPLVFDEFPATKWVIEKANRSVYENFFEPLFKSKFGSYNSISAAWLLSRIKLRSNRTFKGERLGYLRGGFQQLVDKMAEKNESQGCELRTGCKVKELAIENNKVVGVDTSEGFIASDSVIVTTPSLTKTLSINNIKYQNTICALFGTERRLMDDIYWLNIKAEVPFGAIIEHTNFVPRADYGENLVYVVSYVQDEKDPIWKRSDKEVVDLYLDGIAKMFPDFRREDVKWCGLAKKKYTAPIYELGYKNKILPYSSHIEGLYLAGMFSSPNYPERSMNGAIRAGFECAEEVINHEISQD